MTTARSKLVDLSVTRWYHCISRCVRKAFLLSEGAGTGVADRKGWIEWRLKELVETFAISVGGYSIMDNHLHLLVRVDPQVAQAWSAEQVVTRWFTLFPPKGSDRKLLVGEPLEVLRAKRAGDAEWVAVIRERLATLGWFMKCLKEPLSRLINRAENCTGAFFEGRYKSIAILDEEALLSACAYIDLNPVAAGIAPAPEESLHTSVKARVENVKQKGREADLQAAQDGSVLGSQASCKLEEDLWLLPIEDRRRFDSQREGMIEGLSLGNYLILVEFTGRLFRDGKASISAELADIFERLGSSVEVWQARMAKLKSGGGLGRFLATNRERLREAAKKLGVHHLANLSGCAA